MSIATHLLASFSRTNRNRKRPFLRYAIFLLFILLLLIQCVLQHHANLHGFFVYFSDSIFGCSFIESEKKKKKKKSLFAPFIRWHYESSIIYWINWNFIRYRIDIGKHCMRKSHLQMINKNRNEKKNKNKNSNNCTIH